MFNSKASDPVVEECLEELRDLKKQVALLKAEKDALTDHRKLESERTRLREELETLRIEKARKEEEHAREKRDVEHATGLVRKQAEWDRDKAVDEARLAVREENLTADQTRFTEQMEFHKDQIKAEIVRFENLLTEVLKRLPTVTVNQSGTSPAKTKAA